MEVEQLQISPTAMESGIRDAPALSAAAVTGWTFDLIAQLTLKSKDFKKKDEDAADKCREALRRVFNFMLDGKGGVASQWVASRLVCLGKPDGGIRPIAIGETFYRLMARIAAHSASRRSGESLAPFQYGVGISGGAEIITHTMRMVESFLTARDSGQHHFESEDASDPTCALLVDYRNAFNELKRGAIFEGVCELCPYLLKVFRWGYGGKSPLYLGNGTVVCHSGTGVRQGDPLGPLFFAVGIQSMVQQLHRKFPAIHGLFYLDDGTLVGPRSALSAAFRWLEVEGDKIGLKANRAKTVLWDTTSQAATFENIKVERSGVKLLGGPLGGDLEVALEGVDASRGFVETFVATHLKKRAESLDALAHIPTNTAFILLRACINARPGYLMRSLPPWVTRDSAIDFDSAVDGCLAKLALWQGPLPELAKAIRGLPLAYAGLATRRMELCRECAYAASFLSAAYHIQRNHQWIWELCTTDQSFLLTREVALLKQQGGAGDAEGRGGPRRQ